MRIGRRTNTRRGAIVSPWLPAVVLAAVALGGCGGGGSTAAPPDAATGAPVASSPASSAPGSALPGASPPAPALRRIAIDINAPIDGAGAYVAGTDPDIAAALGSPSVRMNFILGPWSAPGDQTLHQGRTWLQTYDAIVDAFVARGIAVYGLIGAEASPLPHRPELRDAASSQVAKDFAGAYVAAFVQIVEHFRDRVRVFESYNEPNDWGGGTNAQLHARWFARVLRDIYQEVKVSHGGDPTWDVTLVSGPLFSFDLTDASDYLRETYAYGRADWGWDAFAAANGTYPLDGVGYHAYMDQDLSGGLAGAVAALRGNVDGIHSALALEEGGATAKRIWVSECGWQAAVVGEQAQADILEAALDDLAADPRVALATWFCLGDFPGSSFGVYRAGPLDPSGRRPAHDALAHALSRTP